MTTKRWVYRFQDLPLLKQEVGDDPEAIRSVLGGKGAGLAEMTYAGLPVPPGFTITTEACRYYLSHDEQLPPGLWDQVLEALKDVEAQTGKRFGDPEKPLLVSVRSGAKVSMPGMMDTVLNVGLTDVSAQGMIALTGDERFVYDAYRRLIQMYGSIVLGIPEDAFENVLKVLKHQKGAKEDTDLDAAALRELVERYKAVVQAFTGQDFPQDPYEQLRLAVEAVFRSWNSKRAQDYRREAGIPDDLGTAVNIVAMVFGNMGWDSGTGVAFTRNPSTGEKEIWGEYLLNAQGEDVVAGIRTPSPIQKMAEELPQVYAQLLDIVDRLERYYRDMQDIEFTIERGKLWMLQTRTGKRTARAAVKIAVDMANEGLISREEAVLRIHPDQVDALLHPQFPPEALEQARREDLLIAKGVPASPGAAVGRVYFDADTAERMAKEEGVPVIMVRPFTKPDDVHGMIASQGILTSEGGATSHAAVVARQFGIPAVVGASGLRIDLKRRRMIADDVIVREGDWISLDGSTGEVFLGQLPTVKPELEEQTDLLTLLDWADEIAARPGMRQGPEGWPTRGLEVWANADSKEDALRARRYGAKGIGLARTEHMFFAPDQLAIVQRFILAESDEERRVLLEQLLPYQRQVFEGLFEAMDGYPVIIRLLDPPLHEFLPSLEQLIEEIARLKARGETQGLAEKEALLARVRALHESNPMMGLRGVRLSVLRPEIVEMQVRAIFEAAANAASRGIEVKPEVMIPLVSHVNELKFIQPRLEAVAQQVMKERGVNFPYKFGTMIEIPRAALTAGEIAQVAEFFSFGTNDLTQMTFGFSRDDAERSFLAHYIEEGLLQRNPFQTIDREGVGRLMRVAVREGREARPDLEVGICGEHGGDPDSIEFCHLIGLNYVSCSPFRVPVARLAAAQAALKHKPA
ncbi:MAG: pyruvate, phosphate dikinase [Chloroflexi bacterium]|nr:pyruvate, phosphate dikinase [Chloroflexota bacterium]